MDTSELVDLEEDLFSIILRYGLYFGAVFQLVCIGACIFLPGNDHPLIPDKTDGNQDVTTSQNTPRRPPHRNRKQEKKKRR